MSEVDIRKWLSDITQTVNSKDLEKHMDLVSENVAVYGLPGGNVLSYADWYSRRKNEFKRGLLKNIGYNKLKIKTIGLRRLIFDVEELMDASNGDLVIINKSITIESGQDEKWRVVEENIKDWKYLRAPKKQRSS